MMAVAGSACTIGLTSTRPPPKRRRDAVREPVERPLPAERVDSGPVRADWEGADPAGADDEVVAVAARRTGARPHVSQ
jgi:hypothetical protein